jgi:hypothetical protein
MNSRRGWSHGVQVRRRVADDSWNPVAGEILIRRIRVRYDDGERVCSVPEAGEEPFSQDDAHRVVAMLHIGSEALEWDPALEGSPEPERYLGTGPYDTGAI